MTDCGCNKPLRIMMLGGAKRVSMGRKFIEAGRRMGYETLLYSYELSPYQPISSVARVITGLRWSDPAVIEDLIRIITAEGIDIVVPFVDGAVAIAATLSQQQPGLFAPTCTPGQAEDFFDKVKADAIFSSLGLPVPGYTARSGGQLIAKPRHGSASNGLRIIASADELADQSAYLIQEYIADRTEYTVDCYVSRDGRITALSPRIRLETSGGEVTRTQTVDDPDITALVQRTLTLTGLKGAVTVQLLRDNTRPERLMLMEINPRLGGGAVCSVHAGADIPAMIIAEGCNLPVTSASTKPGVMIARYPEETVFRL